MQEDKAIFLDKDGTLIPDVPYNINPALISIEKNSIEGLKALQKAGFRLIVISNQPGIGLGYFNQDSLMIVEQTIKALLSERGVHLEAFFYCPHIDSDNCSCRKPKPGMLLKAAEELNINLAASWMIGDILNDMEAGRKAGCKTILIDNGNETEWIMSENRRPDFRVKHINHAAEIILQTNTSQVKNIVEYG